MTNPFNSNRSFNELIFENKNKAYGAYNLRSTQNETIAKSIFITFSAICILVLSAYLMNKRNMDAKASIIDINDSMYVVTVVMPPPETPIDPVVKNPEPLQKSAYSDDLNLKVEDKHVEDPPKVVEAMIFKKDGDLKGKIDSTERDPVIPKVVDNPPIVENNGVIHIASEMPEMKDLYQFIADNLKYPAMAVDAGVTGTVYLSFVVEKDGSVSNVKVLRGIGAGCEEEAVRVVQMMPKWKPGKNNGELVRVQFNLPVKFRLK